ncbi:hypothetical protein V5O48_007255 [Marasmius crinis-equi]|uniref:Transmembrane protein n=1 Tax=Marasmius crinis-equi TaxID=585013 RepID=A0ABR3FH58_9AGAR
MPSVIATIEDFSPLLAYSLDWAQGSSSSDQQVSRYSASSFFATSKTGGTFSFSFTGTGIELFGSKRNNHGGYQVTLDGTSFPSQSGQAADPGTFQTSLFSRNNLNEGIHNITLTNQGTNNQFVDIDFVTFRTSVGRDDEPLIMNTIQDNDPAFVYSPASAWSTTPDNLGTFSGGSGHFASDGTMTFTFEVSSLTDTGISSTDILLQGDAVALYGPVGPSAASYGVQVDGGTTSTFSANKASFVPQVLLYHGSNLGPGKHSLKFVCRPSSGQVCSIDYAEVYTTPSIQGSSGSSAGSVSGGAVAGIVIGVLLFAGLLLFGLFLYLRRRKHQRRKDSQELLVNAAGLDAPASFPDPIPNNYAYTQGTTLAYPAPSQPIPPSTYNSSGQLQYSYSANGSDPSSTITYPASLHRADTADTIARQKSPSVVTTDASAPVIYPYSPSSDLESRSSSSRSVGSSPIFPR